MPASLYQIILMGGKDARLVALKTAVKARATDLGIDPNEIVYLDESSFAGGYDRKKPTFGIYFGNRNKTVPVPLDRLEEDSIVIAPIVTEKTSIGVEIPEALQHINVVEVGMNGDNIPRLGLPPLGGPVQI
ncbi:hypothetical protein [Aureimonas psammosilenae]|uniref:hypothetical protein n=1 Tax=Aureimonas psammosilenae TaxID=2495496 RepID=UPI0012608D32|nr:hypothetical protein [Aureimonas psammosilenae]